MFGKPERGNCLPRVRICSAEHVAAGDGEPCPAALMSLELAGRTNELATVRTNPSPTAESPAFSGTSEGGKLRKTKERSDYGFSGLLADSPSSPKIKTCLSPPVVRRRLLFRRRNGGGW